MSTPRIRHAQLDKQIKEHLKSLISKAPPVKPRTIHTTLDGLLKALGMTVEELRRDRRYARARGDEPIRLETKEGGGNSLYIVEAPPWMPADDFGPLGASWARRAGWG